MLQWQEVDNMARYFFDINKFVQSRGFITDMDQKRNN